MKRRRTRAEWRVLISEWRAGSETAEQYARRKGVNLGTLRWWARELVHELGAAGPAQQETAFTEVVVGARAPASQQRGATTESLVEARLPNGTVLWLDRVMVRELLTGPGAT